MLIVEHAGTCRTCWGLRPGDTAWRMQTQPRRSRMRRTRTGKRIELTARDVEIFKLLERYRYLRSTFIHAFVGGASETRFKERLGHLYHEGGYLDRPQQQWQFANSRYMPVTYENTDAARQVLHQGGILDAGFGSALVRNGAGANRQFAHSLMICEILASIELGARGGPGVRFVSWREILAKAPESTRTASYPLRIPSPEGNGGYLIPDAVFGLEYTVNGKKGYRFFALEADRATMPVFRSNPGQTSYLKKMLAYREIIACQIHKSHFGIPNLLVLTVTTNERHMEQIMKAFGEMGGGSAAFLFKTSDAIGSFDMAPSPMPALLTAPWLRVGFPPLCIAAGSADSVK